VRRSGQSLSKLVRTPGTQAFIHVERVDTVENVNTSPAILKTLDKLYTRFYTRPNSPYSFDPYCPIRPRTCLVNQTSGDSYYDKSLRGALPASASLNPQPQSDLQQRHAASALLAQQLLLFEHPGWDGQLECDGDESAGRERDIHHRSCRPNQTVIPLNPEPPRPGAARVRSSLCEERTARLAFTPETQRRPRQFCSMPTQRLLTPRWKYSASPRPGPAVHHFRGYAGEPAAELSDPRWLLRQPVHRNAGVDNAATFANGLAANGILLTQVGWLNRGPPMKLLCLLLLILASCMPRVRALPLSTSAAM